MDLKQLDYFVRVAELGSFTRASAALNIAQPALSRQIRLLEVELRQNLLTRNGRGAVPTSAGTLLLEHARGILNQVALAREELDAARSQLGGRVSIGLPPSLSKLITVPLTHAIRARLPRAQLTLTEGFSMLMVEGLRVGSLDMAVLYNPQASPDMEGVSLHGEQLVLISPSSIIPNITSPKTVLNNTQAATKKVSIKTKLSSNKILKQKINEDIDDQISFTEASRLPLILPSRPNAFRLLIDSELANHKLQAKIAMEVDGLNAILNLVAEGLGHAVLPRYTLSNFDDTRPFWVRNIHSPRLMSRLDLVTSSRRPATQTQRLALQIVKQVVLETIGRMPV